MVNCAPPPFYKHRVDAPLQARCHDRPHEEAEQRRDVTRRGLPAVAPQLEAHNPKEADPRGAASPVHRERMTVLLIILTHHEPPQPKPPELPGVGTEGMRSL